MKVLMIEHFSESNKYTIELVEFLKKHIELTVLTTDKSPMIGDSKVVVKKTLCGFSKESKYKKILRYISSLICTAKEIIFGNYDVVHIQTFRFYKIEVIMYLLLKPFMKNLVHTAHNILPHENKSLQKSFFKLFYKISDVIIVHNDTSKNMLVDSFMISREKVKVVPHGAYDSYKHIDNNVYSYNTRKKNILFLGLIREYKGVDILLQAVSKLPNEYKKFVTINIKGNKFVDDDYESFIKEKKIQDIVNLDFRFIQEDEISQIYSDTDIVVLPYRSIYGSGALLLSYTFNKPVIVSDLPAFVEETNYGQTGLIFKCGDSDDLSQKIMQMIDKDKNEIDEYKNNIKRLVNEKYNWDMSAFLTKNIYYKGAEG